MGGRALSPGEGRDSGLTVVDVSCLQGALSPSFQMPLLSVWGFFGVSIPVPRSPLSPSCRFLSTCCGWMAGCPTFCSVPFPHLRGLSPREKVHFLNSSYSRLEMRALNGAALFLTWSIWEG